MLFPARHRAGLRDGSIVVAYRRWQRPLVKVGTPLRTPVGLLVVDAVDVVAEEAIGDDEARAAGEPDADALRGLLARFGTGGAVYRIALHREGEDPRIALRAAADLTADEVAAITRRLDRLDRASSRGPWTRTVLDLIAARPAVRAADLAASLGLERDPFKVDVRKLKELGLTESLEVGYRLSPRGEAFRAGEGA